MVRVVFREPRVRICPKQHLTKCQRVPLYPLHQGPNARSFERHEKLF